MACNCGLPNPFGGFLGGGFPRGTIGPYGWIPPPARDVPCCIYEWGWRPTLRCCPGARTPMTDCCCLGIPTDLELRANEVALFNRLLPGGTFSCCNITGYN